MWLTGGNAGIATLRFDFTGLGDSEGEFSDTSFRDNVQDVLAAGRAVLGEIPRPVPLLMVGHSLGGTACLAASRQAEGEVGQWLRGVATINAPSSLERFRKLLGLSQEQLQKLHTHGQVEFQAGPRTVLLKVRVYVCLPATSRTLVATSHALSP